MEHHHDHHDHDHHHEHVHGPGCGHIDVHEGGLCAMGLCGHLDHMHIEAAQQQLQELVRNLQDNEYDEFGIKKKKSKKRKSWTLASTGAGSP